MSKKEKTKLIIHTIAIIILIVILFLAFIIPTQKIPITTQNISITDALETNKTDETIIGEKPETKDSKEDSTSEDGKLACQDSDNKNTSVQGTCIDQSGSYKDSCSKISIREVIEYSCKNSSCISEKLICISNQKCYQGRCIPDSENEHTCFDNLDNDFDNTLDCNDPDCFSDCSLDSDRDGLDDGSEHDLGTDMFDPDTDNDNYSDGEEALAGTDPLDPNWYPGSCKDSDNGNDPNIGGTTTTPQGQQADTCLNPTTLQEYYCERGRIQNQQYGCPALGKSICLSRAGASYCA